MLMQHAVLPLPDTLCYKWCGDQSPKKNKKLIIKMCKMLPGQTSAFMRGAAAVLLLYHM